MRQIRACVVVELDNTGPPGLVESEECAAGKDPRPRSFINMAILFVGLVYC
jgi:hypothetical protein